MYSSLKSPSKKANEPSSYSPSVEVYRQIDTVVVVESNSYMYSRPQSDYYSTSIYYYVRSFRAKRPCNSSADVVMEMKTLCSILVGHVIFLGRPLLSYGTLGSSGVPLGQFFGVCVCVVHKDIYFLFSHQTVRYTSCMYTNGSSSSSIRCELLADLAATSSTLSDSIANSLTTVKS